MNGNEEHSLLLSRLDLWVSGILDMSRFARETMDPDEYLATSYYEHWIHGLELLLIEKGLLTETEIKSRMLKIQKQ